ncbi:low molecular weight phosphotyrosine protein phosphatase [Paraburkholderia sp. 1N]|uniref:protein-tyrosine-phosphatase n=1 Tax=Paraburkholderia solitsugae TaxID=2675748 RepID=A0ABX2BHS0_9BURK|nr:low molecular weight protein-tyrosine-phosphatase [Paraburkholderia solitsugae]NPT40339.1 low molecular weight phosphotyrosine protein phosphatase [Paraburkholderia solitsugae]
MIDSILVVCEGNVCRSPMAQGLLAKQLPEVRVKSAGWAALVGRGPDPMAIELMAERGIDIGGHVAVDLNLQQMRSAQLVLAMTQEQRRRIETSYPFAKGKVYRIGEYERTDIADPYRKGRAAFEMALAQIELGLVGWLDAMIRLTN